MDLNIEKSLKSKIVVLLFLYTTALGTAEVVTAYYSLNYGLTIHAAALFSMVILSAYVREKKFSIIIGSLALLPALRMLATSVPLVDFLNPVYVYMLVYLPLLLVSFLFIKTHKLKARDAGLTIGKYKVQIIIALSGVIFGIVEYLILQEQMLPIRTMNLEAILSMMLIMIFFVGFTEELIFRGIILNNMAKIFSANKSIIFVSILFMLMHAGWKSIPDLIFVFVVSLFYCYVFLKTRCLVGITLSHGLTNIVEFIIIPLILL